MGVDLARADDAARQAERAEQPQQATPEPDTAQIDPAAAYAQEVDQYLTAQQEAAGATPQEMAATVAMLDEQPTEQEIHQAEAMQRDAEASTERQAAELPGAENLAPAAERSSMADQFRAAYESIKAEKAALEDGNERGSSQDQDSGRGAAAAFRSFGR